MEKQPPRFNPSRNIIKQYNLIIFTNTLENTLLVRSQRNHFRKSLKLTTLIYRENQNNMFILLKCLVQLLLFKSPTCRSLGMFLGNTDIFIVTAFDHKVFRGRLQVFRDFCVIQILRSSVLFFGLILGIWRCLRHKAVEG